MTNVARIETAVESVRQAIKGEDRAAIRRASDELQRLSHGMAEELYKRGQTAGAGAGPANHPGASDVKEGEVIDAEYAGADK